MLEFELANIFLVASYRHSCLSVMQHINLNILSNLLAVVVTLQIRSVMSKSQNNRPDYIIYSQTVSV